jgi:hypothetical protein
MADNDPHARSRRDEFVDAELGVHVCDLLDVISEHKADQVGRQAKITDSSTTAEGVPQPPS